ncbi:acid-sensing ion channel 1C-like isoform X2 [Patiria miniata]|nr:acid-sensing ion channel 1C-like isoform X2 [Patiria miniata]
MNDYDHQGFFSSYSEDVNPWDFLDYYQQQSDVGNVDCSEFSFTDFTKRTGFILDEDTLLDCDWRGRKGSCSAADFTHSFTSFGNCWTFNSGKNGADIVTESLPGSGNGLRVLIDIQQSEYTETLDGNCEAGLKVVIHDQGTPPAVDSAGMAIQPGVHAYIATRALKYVNLEPPWGECDSSKTLENQQAYTMEGCMSECRARLVFKHCNCRLVRHPGKTVECTVAQTKDCGMKILAQIQSGEINECDCPVPCKYTRFATSLSTASVASQVIANQIWLATLFDTVELGSDSDATVTASPIYGTVGSSSSSLYSAKSSSYSSSDADDDPSNDTDPYDPEYINKNWIVLDVFYSEINFQKYEQSIAITPSGLISDIGGQLGLFLGASFITIAEILAYLGQRFGRGVQKTVAKGRRIRPSMLTVDKARKKGVDIAWMV